jgi:hypothetical protein
VRILPESTPLLLAALLAGPGCKVGAKDLDRWRHTENGPYRIRTALSDAEQPLAIRAAAAATLVEIGLVEQMAGDLQALPIEDGRRVADAAAPLLVARMTGAAPADKEAVQAKDALFAVRERLSPPVRRDAEAALVAWLVRDLPGRALLGANGADRMVAAMGIAAGPALIQLLGAPGADVAEAARLLVLCDDRPERERAADVLVARARGERPPREATFLGLARLGGPRVVAWLAETATGGEPQARLWALRALQATPDPSAVAAAASVAGDRTLTADRATLRDEAFGVLEEIARGGDEAARGALLGFLGNADDKVRWRAIGAIVGSGDTVVLARLLDALPEASLGAPSDLHDFVEAPLLRAGGIALATLRAALGAHSPAGRLVAARLLGEIGTAEDRPKLEALFADRTRLRGWSGRPTLGEEARAAAERLRARAP